MVEKDIINFDLGLDPDHNKDEKPCKGLIFRGYSSFYTHNDNRIESREGVKLLKKKSCSGCERCGWMWEDITESIACDGAVIFPQNIENGELYSVRVVNEYKNWEGEYSYDLEIYKIEEKKDES